MNEYQISEFRKCGFSFKYFCENYVKITNPGKGKGLIPFKLYPFQERVVDNFLDNRFNIVRKFRQAGLTTVASIYGLWKCMFDTDQRILLISKTDREAVKVGADISMVIQHIPEWLKPEMKANAKHEKEFVNTNSLMWFYTPEAARSRAASFLILDEAAFIKNMSEHWAAMYPVLSSGGSCAVISTVNGMRGIGEWYYEIYTKAEKNQNGFNVINLQFKEHPDYAKPEFEALTRPNLGEKRWAQEFLGTFHGSGETYISATDLARIHSECEVPTKKLWPEWDTSPTPIEDIDRLTGGSNEKGAMWQWGDREDGVEYIVSADASHGAGEDGDASTIQVMSLNTFEQVAEFQSNSIDIFDFSQLVAQVGAYYNEAIVVIENNGPGNTLVKSLHEKLRYPNMYHSPSGKNNIPGLNLQKSNREMVLENMRTCLSKNLVKINSYRLHDELQAFVINKRTMKPEASQGKHDDLVMALAIALYVSDAMSRDVPINAKDISHIKDIVGDALLGEGLDVIRETLEKGGHAQDDDLSWAAEMDLLDIMPDRSYVDKLAKESYFFRSTPKRPNDSFLKSFGL